MLRCRTRLALLGVLICATLPCVADFNWGNCGSNGGQGSFNQPVAQSAILTVGDIIPGLRDVQINLRSSTDIDVQLYDKVSGHAIIKWPDGALNGAGYQTISYGGSTIAWSGYNGDGSGLGHEYITITGTTDRTYVMKVYGFQAGSAEVTYSWKGGGSNSGNCDGGSGQFQQQIAHSAVVDVGTIPSGLDDVYISLASRDDVDVQLFDKDSGTAIVEWPSGILNNSGPQSTQYRDMTIVWSGYNGDQVPDRYGYEFIAIRGRTTRTLVMKAYGFQSGYARVNYSWGKRPIAYAGIQGAAEYSAVIDGSTKKVLEAVGCSNLTKVVEKFADERNPNSTSDLRSIAQTDLGGLWSLGYHIGCGSTFGANSRSALYKPGNPTLAKLDLQKYYNDNKQRARVYLAGFSAGGGDIQTLGFQLRDLGIPVQLSVHIDSVEIGWDERIASNVRRAMGFYQNEAAQGLARGEDGLRPEFDFGGDYITYVTNDRVSGPDGPEKAQTAPGNYQHRNMDNDSRTWQPFLDYLNLHR